MLSHDAMEGAGEEKEKVVVVVVAAAAVPLLVVVNLLRPVNIYYIYQEQVW